MTALQAIEHSSNSEGFIILLGQYTAYRDKNNVLRWVDGPRAEAPVELNALFAEQWEVDYRCAACCEASNLYNANKTLLQKGGINVSRN